jgi:uncharacterized repeat protein (TIGR01451 family)
MRCYYSAATLLVACIVFSPGCTKQGAERHTANKPSLSTHNVSSSDSSENKEAAAEHLTDSEQTSAAKVTLKVEAPEKVPVGSSYRYRVEVTNHDAQAEVRNVKVVQVLPSGFAIDSSKPEGKMSAGEATWIIDEIKAGGTQTIEVTASSEKEGAQHACFSVTYTPTVCTVTQFVKPDIEIVKQAPQQANLCDPIVVTYQLTNHGSGEARDIIVKDALAKGLKTADGKNAVELKVDSLAAGKMVELKQSLVADQPGKFSSRAVATAAGGDESRSASSTIEVSAPQLDINLDGPASQYIGRVVNYKVSTKNVGNAPAENAAIVLTIPNGARMAWASAATVSGKGAPQDDAASDAKPQRSDDGKTVTWKLGNLQPDQTAEASISFTGREKGDLKFAAQSTLDCAAIPGGHKIIKTTNLFALPALALSVVDTPDPVKVGEEVRYIITVLNEGNAPEEQVQITATLPEKMEHISHSGKTEGKLEGQKLVFQPLDKLGAGERVTWTIIAKAKEAMDTKLSVELNSKTQGKATAEEPTTFFATDK